jgi:uncharacterized protein YjbI with pentapeptide repeats
MGLSLLDIEKLRTEAEGVNLRGANLSRSKLSGIQGIKADFTDAVMHQVRLQRANLKQAILTNADLAGADLSGADLTGADLTDAVLVGAKTEFMRTHQAIMTGVLTDLPSGKPLDKAQFFESLTQHALWVRTQGSEGNAAVFDHHDLRDAGALNDMDLTALQAKNAVLFGMNLQGARLQGANLEGADLRHANLGGADLRGVRLKGARLDGAIFEGADLSPLELGKGRILNADLSHIKGRSIVMKNANLRGVRFQGAELIGASFEGSQLDPNALAEANHSAVATGPKAA